MNKYQAKYAEIENNGFSRDEKIAELIINTIEANLNITLPSSSDDNINHLLSLFRTELKDYVREIVSNYNYRYRTELLYLLINMCNNHLNVQGLIEDFDVIFEASEEDKRFVLDTMYGNATVFKLREKFPQYSNYVSYRHCHNVCCDFIYRYTGCQATTVLLDSLFVPYSFLDSITSLLLRFGGKHYHSFIETDDYVFDLSHNMVVKREEYYRLFNPYVLNSVRHEQLEEEINRIKYIRIK